MAFEVPISLDEVDTPLHRQLYAQVRRAILDGRLQAGSRLPSTRAMATQLRLARNTVTSAYDQLIAEGYLSARSGSGTYVCETLPDESFLVRRRAERHTGRPCDPQPREAPLSRWAVRALEGARREAPEPAGPLPYNFRHGSPAVDQFPFEIWRRLSSRRLRAPALLELGYGPSSGFGGLRVAVAEYLRRARAVRCTPDQVVIVNGSQQALDLLARVCLNPGDAIVLEDPGYIGARRAFATQGARLLPARVDGAGMIVEELDAAAGAIDPRMLYVTPSHQFPTGALMSLPRRLALLRWAQARGTLVLEDDYDSEFRYGGGRPVEALQGLDTTGTVVYIGTFSKVLFPSLRLGYLVLPQSLVEPVSVAKWLSDRYTPTLEQQVLADFFAEGYFERHLRHMRLVYQTRHDAFLEGLRRELGDLVDPPLAETGLHAFVTVRAPISEPALVARCAASGIGIYPARPHYLRPPVETQLVMGYTSLDERAIGEGLRRLGPILRSLTREAVRTGEHAG